MSKVTLDDSQMPHYNRIIEMLSKRHFYIDTSVMGTGKTVLTMAIAQQTKRPLFVLCPKGCRDVWYDEAKKYGIVLIQVMGYSGLIGRKGSQPKHGYIKRKDVGPGNPTLSFYVDASLQTIIDNGALFIFDESHNLRNKESQINMCSSIIINAIYGSKAGRSRFAFLSGTPANKEEQCVTMMKSLQIIVDNHKIWTTGEKNAIFDITQFCSHYFKETFDVFNMTHPKPSNGKTANLWAYQCFTKVIFPQIATAMPKVPLPFPIDIKNVVYKMAPERAKELNVAVSLLKMHIIDPSTGMKRTNIFGYEEKLVAIDYAKREIFATQAYKVLMTVPGSKVCIFIDHLKPIDYVEQCLTHWGFKVLKITGETKPEERTDYINKFRYDSNYRVLVGTTRSCSTGINLHDEIGGQPRTMFISPSFHAMNLVQISHRIYRRGLKSPATVRMVYGNTEDSLEKRIYEILADRSAVLKDLLTQQVEDGFKFPIDYEFEKEE